jgi:hypothetical protein
MAATSTASATPIGRSPYVDTEGTAAAEPLGTPLRTVNTYRPS